jgi:hypothetical protein
VCGGSHTYRSRQSSVIWSRVMVKFETITIRSPPRFRISHSSRSSTTIFPDNSDMIPPLPEVVFTFGVRVMRRAPPSWQRASPRISKSSGNKWAQLLNVSSNPPAPFFPLLWLGYTRRGWLHSLERDWIMPSTCKSMNKVQTPRVSGCERVTPMKQCKYPNSTSASKQHKHIGQTREDVSTYLHATTATSPTAATIIRCKIRLLNCFLDGLGFEKMIVERDLQRCRLAAHHFDKLGREMLREKCVGSTQNELVGDGRQLTRRSFSTFRVLVRAVRFHPSENRSLKLFAKLSNSVQTPRKRMGVRRGSHIVPENPEIGGHGLRTCRERPGCKS